MCSEVQLSTSFCMTALFAKRRALRLVFLGWIASALFPAVSHSQRAPAELKTLEDSITPEPRVRGFAPVIGVLVDRAGAPRKDTLDAWLMVPSSEIKVLGERICLTARSRDGRLRYRGELEKGKLVDVGPGWPVVRAKATDNGKREIFVRALDSSELSMIAEVGCGEAAVAPETLRTFVALDPDPSAQASRRQLAPVLRVLLNAGEMNITAAYSQAVPGVAALVRCQRIEAPDATAFNVECRLPLPSAERATVVITRNRPLDTPLVERFVLLMAALR